MRCAVLRRGSFLASRRSSGALATSALIAKPHAAMAASRTTGSTEPDSGPRAKPYRVTATARRYYIDPLSHAFRVGVVLPHSENVALNRKRLSPHGCFQR